MAYSQDTELRTNTIKVESKLFYLDLKENPRGRYLKISEKAAGGRSTVIVPSAGVVWFVDLLNYYASPPSAGEELTSKELQLDTKTFYFDVGDNPRGRFLKISEKGASLARNRSMVIIPAATDNSGWAQFRNALVEMHQALEVLPPLEEVPASGREVEIGMNGAEQPGYHLPNGVGGVDGGDSAPAAIAANDSRVVLADKKKFFFDMGENARGRFLKISEVVGSDRSSVIIPANALPQFYEALGSFLQ